jgi:hypothetical protein
MSRLLIATQLCRTAKGMQRCLGQLRCWTTVLLLLVPLLL